MFLEPFKMLSETRDVRLKYGMFALSVCTFELRDVILDVTFDTLIVIIPFL